MLKISKHIPDELMYGRFPELVSDTILDLVGNNENIVNAMLASHEKGKAMGDRLAT